MNKHALGQWLEDKKQSGDRLPQYKLAEQVACAPSRISQIINNGSVPSLALAAKLSKATGIPLDKFVKQDDEASAA
jgi:transcriptional regulator with XRE-family HTH domain